MVRMMQQMGAMPVVGPGAVANGAGAGLGTDPIELYGDAGSADANKEILLPLHRRTRANADEAAASGAASTRAPSSTTTPAGARPTSRSAVESHAALRRALPDLTFEVDRSNMVCDGNQVAAHSIVRERTPARRSSAPSPPGGELVWTHSDFVRLADGRIVERWTATDMLTLFQRAGVLPSAG